MYNPLNKVVIGPNWQQNTNYVAGPGRYSAFWNTSFSQLNLGSLTPADRDQTVAQVVYQVIRFPESTSGTSFATSWYSYDDTAGGFPSNYRSYGDSTRTFDFTAPEYEFECLNLKPRWCGDGVVDTNRGETCDDGATNGTPGAMCSSTCSRNLFDLSLKKFVQSDDAQTPATAVSVTTGTPFTYTFVVTNNGSSLATGTTSVSDRAIPAEIQLTSVPTGAGWQCSLVSGGFVCVRTDDLAVGASFPTISVTAIVPSAISGTYTNTATVNNPDENPANNFGSNNTDPANIRVTPPTNACVPGTTVGVQTAPVTSTTLGLCQAGSAVGGFTSLTGSTADGRFTYGYTWSCGVSAVGGACSATYTEPPQGFNLALKKFIDGVDADNQPTAYNSAAGANINYTFVVRNTGPNAVSGVTTVTDSSFPLSITLTGTPSGAGWSCSIAGSRSFTCTRSDTLAVGASFPTITAPANISATAAVNSLLINTAVVSNPGDTTLADNTDPAHIIILPPIGGFDLSLKKYVGVPSATSDAQTTGTAVGVSASTAFVYTLRITNNGTAAISGVTTVTDPGPATGVNFTGIPTGAGWSCTLVGRAISCTRSDSVASGVSFPDISIPATTTSTTGTFLNTASVANPNENPTNNFGNNNTDPANVSVGLITADVFDLSLKKYVGTPSAATDAQTAATAIGVTANTDYTYTFRVTNNGLATASGVTTVTDSGVTGVTFIGVPTGTGWLCTSVGAGFSCTRSDTLANGANFPDITTTARVTSTAAANYLNTASVANPNENPTNNFGNNNTDPANVSVGLVVVTPICATLTTNDASVSASVPFSRNLTCTATASAGATPTFQILCGNGQTINAATGTCTYSAFGTNTARCSVNGQVSADIPTSCQLNITASIGGGGPGTCQELAFTPVSNIGSTYSVSMSCTATAAAGPSPTIEVDCGNGQTLVGASGICRYSTAAGASFPYTATCRVNGSTQGAPSQNPGVFAPNSCRQSISFSTGAPLPVGGYCGNGIIDRYTYTIQSPTLLTQGTGQPVAPVCTVVNKTVIVNGINTQVFDYYTCTITTQETCDAGGANGAPLNNPSCIACQLTNQPLIGTSTTPRQNPIDILFARSGQSIKLVSQFRSIVGNEVSTFQSGDRFILQGAFPAYIGGLQAGLVNNATSQSLIAGSSIYNTVAGDVCIGNGTMKLPSGAVQNCENYTVFTAGSNGIIGGQSYLGKTSGIPSGQAMAEVNPLLPNSPIVRESNFYVAVNYLNEPIPVRVSRPAISNTAGGNAYIGAQVGYSVNTITAAFISNISTGNFTVSSTAKNSSIALSSTTSSSTATISDSQKDTIQKFGESNTLSVVAQTVVINSLADFESKLTRLGDANNIYVLKKGILKINTPLELTGVKTILIEEGTLEIGANTTYAAGASGASWAFIIKKPTNGSPAIKIASTVTDIAGVYLALSGEAVGSGPTPNQLAIDGNINARISKLVDDRTYIRADEASTALTTGLTINYSTRAFKSPPPLLTQYLEQYNLDRVSR